MEKVLEKYKINFILLQMSAFSFICIMAYIDYFLSIDPVLLLRFTVLSFTALVVLIYEFIILFYYKKARNNYKLKQNNENQSFNYNERYLWFVLLLLLDLIIIVSLISLKFKKIHIVILLIIAFIIFSIISTIVKPYFGIKHKK